MFIEKYRPKTFNEILGQSNIVSAIKKLIKKYSIIPNLLFNGGPGTGKTTLAHVIAKSLFGEDYRNCFLELNASSDRGIDIVRNRINEFARTKGYHKYKIVFLDEASEITKDAQNALRRIMELNYKNCRFILTCNYIEKIIDPLISRCIPFNFKRIKNKDLLELANKVCVQEKYKLKESELKILVLESNGDARRLLNLLETAITGNKIEDFESLLSDIYSLSIEEFIKLVYQADNERILNELIKQGITRKNTKIVKILADCDYRFRLGTIKTLQLIAAFLQIKNL
jgi:replication factor C small subunit